MYKKIRLLMTALLGVTVWGGTAQINGTVLSDLIPSEVKDTVSKGEVPDVSYSPRNVIRLLVFRSPGPRITMTLC